VLLGRKQKTSAELIPVTIVEVTPPLVSPTFRSVRVQEVVVQL
jgi:hypothetical protein